MYKAVYLLLQLVKTIYFLCNNIRYFLLITNSFINLMKKKNNVYAYEEVNYNQTIFQ